MVSRRRMPAPPALRRYFSLLPARVSAQESGSSLIRPFATSCAFYVLLTPDVLRKFRYHLQECAQPTALMLLCRLIEVGYSQKMLQVCLYVVDAVLPAFILPARRCFCARASLPPHTTFGPPAPTCYHSLSCHAALCLCAARLILARFICLLRHHLPFTPPFEQRA